jgi:hypothetical protein
MSHASERANQESTTFKSCIDEGTSFEAEDTERTDDLEREHGGDFVCRLEIRTILPRCRLLHGGGDPGVNHGQHSLTCMGYRWRT